MSEHIDYFGLCQGLKLLQIFDKLIILITITDKLMTALLESIVHLSISVYCDNINAQ